MLRPATPIGAIPFVGVVPRIRDYNTANQIVQDLDSYSLYASATYSLTDRVRGTLGIRYMSEEEVAIQLGNTIP